MRIPWYAGWPLALGLLYALLCYLASRSVYFPSRYPEGFWEMQGRLGAQDVWLDTRDRQRIHGWWLARPGTRRVTLFLHGNAGNITHRFPSMSAIADAGSSILMIDYRGYGRSSGSPTERGLYADADAAYDYLIAHGHKPEDIVLHGESLGTAVAVDLAVRRPCAGVILEAPFPSARAVAATVLPVVGPMLIWGFDTVRKLDRVHVPVLVIQGDRDEVIPPPLGQAVYDAVRGKKWFMRVPGAGHNDILETAGPAYESGLREFYREL